jgi:hypothetical protein
MWAQNNQGKLKDSSPQKFCDNDHILSALLKDQSLTQPQQHFLLNQE